MNYPGKSEVARITSHFGRKKILVFGDIGIDKYTVGKVSRISPEAPIPIVEVQETTLKLGLAANVAENIVALGGKVCLVGLVGKDASGGELKALMKKRKMSTSFLVEDESRKTTLKERVVAEHQQVVRIDHETAEKPTAEILQEVWGKIEKVLNEVDAIIIEDYAKGLVEVSLCRQIVSAAEEKKIPVFVDPNLRSPLQLYYGCTVMTPNSPEAEALSGIKITDYEKLSQAGIRLMEESSAKTVIITRGRDGMAVFNRGEAEPALIPTFARDVFDVSGAGDTTIATLALCLASGADTLAAAIIANYAAGIVVGKRGTATTTVAEIKEYVDFISKLKLKRKRGK